MSPVCFTKTEVDRTPVWLDSFMCQYFLWQEQFLLIFLSFCMSSASQKSYLALVVYTNITFHRLLQNCILL